jgi:hypothetical protein
VEKICARSNIFEGGEGMGESRRPTRKDAEVDFAARVLAVRLGNQATYTQWFDAVVKATPSKKNRKTGEMKPGMSETKFRGLRKALLEQGRVIQLTTGQDGIYSIVGGLWTVSGVGGSVVMDSHEAPQSTANPSQGGAEGDTRAEELARLKQQLGSCGRVE